MCIVGVKQILNNFHSVLYYLCSSILFIPTVMVAQEVETVTAIGFGEDVNTATQRAVESALTQVVGSFIDAENFIKQKTEIQNAVSKTSKTISSSFSSYSQGSVKSLSIIDVTDSGSMKKVTARVTIRIEDFKRYIREEAFGEAKIKGGLFANAKVKQKQGENLSELVVEKILSPARNFEAIEIKVGEVALLEDVDVERSVAGVVKDLKNKILVRVPVTVQIKQDYLANAYKILDETSVDRYKGGQIKSINVNEKEYGPRDSFYLLLFADMVHDRSGSDESVFGRSSAGVWGLFSRAGLTSGNYINPMQARLYALPKSNLFELYERMQSANLETGTPGFIDKNSVPSVNLRVLDSMGNIIFEDYLTHSERGIVNSSSSMIAGEGFHNAAEESLTVLFSNLRPGLSRKYKHLPKGPLPENFAALIDVVKKFEIITALPEDVLEVADSVQVEISR